MDEPPSAILIVVILLVLLSSFFSGSEAALLSIGRAKVRALRQQKKMGSTALEWLKNHPKKLIITILIGNNVVNVLIPVLATLWATERFGDHVLGIVTGLLTVVLLVFGEILPKNIGQIHNEKFSLFVAPILYFLAKGMMPVVWVFEKFSDALVTKKKQDPITEDEVRAMVSLGEEGGAIDTEERELIENVLEFTDTTTEEVMTPRANMKTLSDNATLGEAVQYFIDYSHSRIPVYEESIDDIVGIITIKQTLKAWKQYDDHKLVKNLEFKTPLFVPTTKKISHLFRDFQRKRIHMAIVVDEHGGTAGIITMEDILEEVFGEIVDESDLEDSLIRRLSDNSWIVPGTIELTDLADETGVGIDTEEDDSKTLSLFILEQTEDIPERGDRVSVGEVDLVIEKMDGHRIDRVRLIRKESSVLSHES